MSAGKPSRRSAASTSDGRDFVHWRHRLGGGLYSGGSDQCTKSRTNGVASVQSRVVSCHGHRFVALADDSPGTDRPKTRGNGRGVHGIPVWTQRPAPVALSGQAKVRNSSASREAARVAGEVSTCGYVFSHRSRLRAFDAGATHFRMLTAHADLEHFPGARAVLPPSRQDAISSFTSCPSLLRACCHALHAFFHTAIFSISNR